jgi:alginate O-acetyltransferase complex protein AlgI
MDIQSILTPVWDYLKNILAYKEDTPLLFTQFYFWAFFALVFALFSLFYKRKQLRTVFLLFASLFFITKPAVYVC